MEKEKSSPNNDKWRSAIVNLSEISSNLDSVQKILTKKAVFVDEDTFAKASLSSEQSRTIKTLEQRVETLERELDASIAAAARARAEKRQAEAAQKAAELLVQDVTKELENTAKRAGSSPGLFTYVRERLCALIDHPQSSESRENSIRWETAWEVLSLEYGSLWHWTLEQRVETLERELDASIAAAARARAEKRQAEAAQKAAELRVQDVTKELENTTKVFQLHMEELRSKQEEIAKKDHEVKVLEAIIQTLSRNDLS